MAACASQPRVGVGGFRRQYGRVACTAVPPIIGVPAGIGGALVPRLPVTYDTLRGAERKMTFHAMRAFYPVPDVVARANGEV